MDERTEIKGIDSEEALELLNGSDDNLLELLARADKLRRKYRGNKIATCSIINAKSGNCSMDCRYCAQSKFSNSQIEIFKLMEVAELVSAADKIAVQSPSRIGIVTSGKTIKSTDELNVIIDAVKKISERYPKIEICASLGAMDEYSLLKLRKSGLKRYHHNLETAESFYPQVCSSQQYERKIKTVKLAKRAGLKVCSGGILGIGENNQQRIEFFNTLIQLGVDSVPLNFFHPFEGMRVEKHQEFSPPECLRIIAVARLMMPEKEIRLCGGREYHLRDFQGMLLYSGIDGIMIGGYLTIKGRSAEDDLQMIKDAGLELA